MDTADADVAQLAEQLICNQQVFGSSPNIGNFCLSINLIKNETIKKWVGSRVAKGDRL